MVPATCQLALRACALAKWSRRGSLTDKLCVVSRQKRDLIASQQRRPITSREYNNAFGPYPINSFPIQPNIPSTSIAPLGRRCIRMHCTWTFPDALCLQPGHQCKPPSGQTTHYGSSHNRSTSSIPLWQGLPFYNDGAGRSLLLL